MSHYKKAIITGLISLLLLLCFSLVNAQEPLGDANEVWVTCTSDTIYSGQEIELEIHIANDFHAYGVTTTYRIFADDGTLWNWAEQPLYPWTDLEQEINKQIIKFIGQQKKS